MRRISPRLSQDSHSWWSPQTKAKDCIARLYVDGTRVADLRPSEQIRMFIAEGQAIFGVSAFRCFGGGTDQIAVDVTRAKPVLLRVSIGDGKGMAISRPF